MEKEGKILRIKKYVEIVVSTETKSTNIKPNYCNSIIFTNQGTTNAYLFHNIVILPNQTHSFNFDENEYIKTNIPLSFDSNNDVRNNIAITKLYYEEK